jgi:hypothetical protein
VSSVVKVVSFESVEECFVGAARERLRVQRERTFLCLPALRRFVRFRMRAGAFLRLLLRTRLVLFRVIWVSSPALGRPFVGAAKGRPAARVRRV